MSDAESGGNLTFSVSGDTIGKIRKTDLPAGTIMAPGIEDVMAQKREVTRRALAMTVGLFQFAARSHREDPQRKNG